MSKTHLVVVVVGLFSLMAVGGCASAPQPKAEPVVVVEPEPEPEPLPSIPGDDKVPERFRKAFGEWLKGDEASVYSRVVEVSEVSNALSVVVTRRYEGDGECRTGPSTVEFMEQDGAFQTEVTHFGDDCCPGTTCAVSNLGYNLRWIAAVAGKDWAALSALVPAKGKLTWELVTSDGDKVKKVRKSFTRKDIAAGKGENLPGCGFINTRPDCELPDPKTGGFTCSCNGGGTHTTYTWKKDGDAMVVVRIDESSH
jgi:hypothetical protein